jgi:hypothetical protein
MVCTGFNKTGATKVNVKGNLNVSPEELKIFLTKEE